MPDIIELIEQHPDVTGAVTSIAPAEPEEDLSIPPFLQRNPDGSLKWPTERTSQKTSPTEPVSSWKSEDGDSNASTPTSGCASTTKPAPLPDDPLERLRLFSLVPQVVLPQRELSEAEQREKIKTHNRVSKMLAKKAGHDVVLEGKAALDAIKRGKR